MKVYNRKNKNGQRVLAMSNYNIKGDTLYHAYKTPSAEKLKAYEWCKQKFLDTPHSYGFRICGCNTFGFTAAWEGDFIDGDGWVHKATYVETKCNSYVVI